MTVVMLCGVAGSGKTTLATTLEAQGHVRLSVDEEIWATDGRYGIDYPPAEYAERSRAAQLRVRERLVALLADGRDVVLDLSFWRRSDREDYKRLIESHGGTWRLIYLRVGREELRRRLATRAERFDANAAFVISDERLDGYLDGFEEPEGEGEELS